MRHIFWTWPKQKFVLLDCAYLFTRVLFFFFPFFPMREGDKVERNQFLIEKLNFRMTDLAN